jgi:hypothetical protein
VFCVKCDMSKTCADGNCYFVELATLTCSSMITLMENKCFYPFLKNKIRYPFKKEQTCVFPVAC